MIEQENSMNSFILNGYKFVNKVGLQLQERFFRNTRVFGLPFHLVLETGSGGWTRYSRLLSVAIPGGYAVASSGV